MHGQNQEDCQGRALGALFDPTLPNLLRPMFSQSGATGKAPLEELPTIHPNRILSFSESPVQV